MLKKVTYYFIFFFFISHFVTQAMENNNRFLIVVSTENIAPIASAFDIATDAQKLANLGSLKKKLSNRAQTLLFKDNIPNYRKMTHIFIEGQGIAQKTNGPGNVVALLIQNLKNNNQLEETDVPIMQDYILQYIADNVKPDQQVINQVTQWNSGEVDKKKPGILTTLISNHVPFIAGISNHDPISFPAYYKKLKDQKIDLSLLLPAGCVIWLSEADTKDDNNEPKPWDNWPVIETSEWQQSINCINSFKQLAKELKRIYVYIPGKESNDINKARFEKSIGSKRIPEIVLVDNEEKLASCLMLEESIPTSIKVSEFSSDSKGYTSEERKEIYDSEFNSDGIQQFKNLKKIDEVKEESSDLRGSRTPLIDSRDSILRRSMERESDNNVINMQNVPIEEGNEKKMVRFSVNNGEDSETENQTVEENQQILKNEKEQKIQELLQAIREVRNEIGKDTEEIHKNDYEDRNNEDQIKEDASSVLENSKISQGITKKIEGIKQALVENQQSLNETKKILEETEIVLQQNQHVIDKCEYKNIGKKDIIDGEENENDNKEEDEEEELEENDEWDKKFEQLNNVIYRLSGRGNIENGLENNREEEYEEVDIGYELNKPQSQSSLFRYKKTFILTGLFTTGIAALGAWWKYNKSLPHFVTPVFSFFDSVKTGAQNWWRGATDSIWGSFAAWNVKKG